MTGFCEFRSLCVKKYTDRAVKTTRDSMFSNQAAIMEIQRIYFTLVVTQILEYSYCQNNFCKSNFSLHLMQIAEL